MTSPATARVLAVLDEASAAAALLEYSTKLAQLMQRQLQLVYVESAAALAAAELSATRVLGLANTRWAPFAPPDVERAWRAQALRLRSLAERASQPRAVPWSLRVTRGALRAAALELLAEADLLLVGGAPAGFTPARGRPARPVVAVRHDGGAEGQETRRIAARLSEALNARLVEIPLGAERIGPVDLIVVPASVVTEAMLAAAPAPLLLVRQRAQADESAT